MINIDMWYGNSHKEADKIDISFYPNDGKYRGNIYINGKIVGDYVCDDFFRTGKEFFSINF